MFIIRRSNCIIQHLVLSYSAGGCPVRRSLSWSVAKIIEEHESPIEFLLLVSHSYLEESVRGLSRT